MTPADAIVQAAKQLADALRGNLPPPLVKTGINHLKQFTTIFNKAKDAYKQRNAKLRSALTIRGCLRVRELRGWPKTSHPS